jgi:hypothetical protein
MVVVTVKMKSVSLVLILVGISGNGACCSDMRVAAVTLSAVNTSSW